TGILRANELTVHQGAPFGCRAAQLDTELLPGADRRTVGDQRPGTGLVVGDDLAVRVRDQRDLAVIEKTGGVEHLPTADRGAVGDERGVASVLRRNDLAVGEGAETDRARRHDVVEILPGSDRGAVGDERGVAE